ncbi:MAG: RNA ligase family protein [archaeon]
MNVIKYPEIKQFREAVESVKRKTQYVKTDEDTGYPVYDRNLKLPVLKAKGTVKLHGTNSSIAYNLKDELWIQSREKIINVNEDNAGFAFYVEKNKYFFTNLLIKKAEEFNIDLNNNTIVLYGEWCGEKIQKGVAINKLPKMFVIFGLKVRPFDEEPSYWLNHSNIKDPDKQLYNINDYKTWEIDVDFNKPGEALEEMMKYVHEVENECPVGKAFNVSGIGEGIVWTVNDENYKLKWKTKGEKHSKASKAKKPKKVDNKKQNLINEVAIKCLPTWRLEQMYNETFDILNGGKPDIKGTGDFIKAVVKDVHKEEILTISDSGLEPKEMNSTISKIAKDWFFNQLKKESGL